MPRELVTVVGLKGLETALAGAVTKLRAAKVEVVAEEVHDIAADARRIAPRDTGDLEEHIRPLAEEGVGTVTSSSRHAGFVENGTYKDRAQPYMAPAAALARRRIPKRAAAKFKAALED